MKVTPTIIIDYIRTHDIAHGQNNFMALTLDYRGLRLQAQGIVETS